MIGGWQRERTVAVAQWDEWRQAHPDDVVEPMPVAVTEAGRWSQGWLSKVADFVGIPSDSSSADAEYIPPAWLARATATRQCGAG
jgi:hypothetical protein